MNLIHPSRREFLLTTAAATALAGFPAMLKGADQSGSRLKIGFVGCGGRGTGAASQALRGDSNVELWAMGEVFRDKIDSSLETLTKQFADSKDKLNVSEERKFVGLDAYQKVIDSGVDVVILTTPPGFRPLHIRAAVDAGKHIFCEKPMAVDAEGVRSVIESVRLAKQKNLAMMDGFVWRWTKANRETYDRILQGAIGDIHAVYSSYYTGSVDRYPKWTRQNTKTDLEWQLRRWYYFTWLSGDHIVEQAVHSIDKMMWVMGDQAPAKVLCTGGRQARPGEPGGEYGHIYDHFSAEYTWENGTKGFHFCRQIDRCYNQNTDTVFGSKGVYEGESGSKRHVFVRTETPWRWQGPKDDNGYQNEHDELFASIRAGKPVNTGDRFVNTTMAAIMARMSAYTGKEVTWDMAMQSKENLFPANLQWDTKIPVPPVAVPGHNPFV